MGNILQSKLKDVLSQYTYNFSKQQISIELLKGQFSLDNLIINDQKINEILKAQGLPIKLKFGLLKKFFLKLSIIGAKLESMTVDDLVLIFGPADSQPEKFEGAEELEIYNIALKNLVASQNGGKGANYLDPEIFAETARKRMEKLKQEKEELQKKEAEAQERARARAKAKENSKETVNIMGIELFELIKNFLDCSISIQNIYIVYEDQLPDLISYDNLEQLIIMISFQKFSFSNREITKDTDKEGIFKNFMNVSQFLRKSGTWDVSDTAYWNITFENLALTFQTDNPLFITQQELNKMVDLNNAGIVLSKFYETKEMNKARSSFKIFGIDRISFDIVLFYKESSLIPVHAAFLLFDCGKLEANIEAYKISTFLDVLNYFNTRTLGKSFDILKPKFLPLTPQRFDAIASRLRLDANGRAQLAQLRKIIVREYFSQMFYLIQYQGIVGSGVNPELARLIVLNRYCQESKTYKLLFGPRVPESLKLQPEHWVELMSAKKTKPKKEETPAPTEKDLKDRPLESLSRNPKVMIVNKIHFHLRVQVRLQVNFFRLNSTSL